MVVNAADSSNDGRIDIVACCCNVRAQIVRLQFTIVEMLMSHRRAVKTFPLPAIDSHRLSFDISPTLFELELPHLQPESLNRVYSLFSHVKGQTDCHRCCLLIKRASCRFERL